MDNVHLTQSTNKKNHQPIQTNQPEHCILSHKYKTPTTEQNPPKNPSGIYRLKCNTCNNMYIGESVGPITVRHKEHLCYVQTNNPTYACLLHILNNKHEYGTTTETLKLLKPSHKGTRVNCWETFYIQTYHLHNILISKQQVNDINPLYKLADTSRIPPHVPWLSLALHSTKYAQHTGLSFTYLRICL